MVKQGRKDNMDIYWAVNPISDCGTNSHGKYSQAQEGHEDKGEQLIKDFFKNESFLTPA